MTKSPVKRWAERVWAPVRSRWIDHIWIDWAFAAVLVGAHVALLLRTTTVGQIAALTEDERMRLYTTAAEVAALVFGFATAAVAFFYGSANGERVQMMKRVLSDPLLAAWRATLTAPLVAAGICVLAIVLDYKEVGRPWVTWSVEAALVLMAIRCVRLRWLFVQTLSLTGLDSNSGPKFAPGSENIPVTFGQEQRGA
jgi:hypothetical protein